MDYKKYSNTVYSIIGAAMSVHSEMNWGLEEPVYNECLSLELHDRGIDNEPEKKLPVYYKDKLLKKYYRMDIVVGDIIIALKSVKELIPAHRAQLFNYMRITKKPVGLLINFGKENLQGERYGWDPETNECHLLDRWMEVVPEEVDCDYDYDPNEDMLDLEE